MTTFRGLVLVAFLATTPVYAQSGMAWKHVAGTTVDRGLAGPATGAVTSVWYAQGGSLLAQTASGRVFETGDFEHWKLSSSGAAAARLTVPGSRQYTAGRDNIFASEDGGATWINLTGFNNRSVIGGGFTSLAVAPGNPQEVAVANEAGVWRSLDGGMTWSSLNRDLPGLPVRRLADRRTIVLEDGTALAPAAAGLWAKADAAAVAAVPAPLVQRLAVTPDRVWVDSERADVALAAAGSRLFRTVNGGLFWDDVTGSLPDAPIHGIAADRAAGVVYLATDRGVYSGRVPLNDAGPAAGEWTSISRDLPAAAAWDVRLNSDNTLTVALDGYGVFEAQAPHKSRTIRLVNGADLSDRAAAPGSLISIMGARVTTASGGYPVLAASEQSSQLQVPFEAEAGRLSLTLQTSAGEWSAPLVVKNASPAIFVDSEGAPLILDAASGLTMDSNVAVRAGSAIQILVTGLGKVSPEWPTGVPAPADTPPVVTGTVTAFVDGAPAKVSRATLAPGYVGYYVVELEVPRIVNRGAAELRLAMNGEESNRVKLFLEPDLLQ